ncbi:FG-GAP repeat protein [Streptomyces sp. NPDC058371]|uniref:FG-GAP repeat protein n=1 Tax=Streptomyces sp. NPDC058371 TaxID=3346463 RepID=UPI003663095D
MSKRQRIRRYVLAATAVAVAATAGAALASPAAATAPAAVTSDLDDDGYADLAAGVRDATVDGSTKAGYVNVVRGGPEGLGAYGNTRISQARPGIPGVPEQGDRFGAAVAVADMDHDGRDDLVAGAPGEAIGSRAKGGAATLLLGGPNGLVGRYGEGHSVAYQQDTPRVPGVAEAGDAFGAAVTTGDYDHDGTPDVAVGSPGENGSSGGVRVLPSASVDGSCTITPARLVLASPTSALTYGKTLSSH